MWIWLLLLGSSRVWGSTISLDEGCKFIGAVFGKAKSDCEEVSAVCTNIFRLPDSGLMSGYGFFDPTEDRKAISCLEAVEIANAHIQASVDPVFGSRPELFQLFKYCVHKALPELVFGDKRFGPETVAVLKDIHMFIMNEVKQDWSNRVALAETIGRDHLLAFKQLMLQLIQKSLHSPFRVDIETGLYADAFLFWFDMAAIFTDIDLPEPYAIGPIAKQAFKFLPSYRARNFAEHGNVLIYPSLSADSAKDLADTIVYLSEAAASWSQEDQAPILLHDSDISGLEMVISSDNNKGKATEGILRYLILSRMCPVIAAVMDLVRLSFFLNKANAVKFAISLIDLCVSHAAVSNRLEASLLIGHLDQDVTFGTELDLSREIHTGIFYETIMDDQKPWIASLVITLDVSPEVFRDEAFHLFSPFRALLDGHNGFFARSYFPLPYEYRSFHRGMGRVIGYCIRYDTNLFVTNLHPALVLVLLIPSYEAAKSYANIYGMDPVLEVLEPVQYVREGIMDVMGPGVFNTLTMEEFRSFFLSKPV